MAYTLNCRQDNNPTDVFTDEQPKPRKTFLYTKGYYATGERALPRVLVHMSSFHVIKDAQ
jgi:hypothetical protein